MGGSYLILINSSLLSRKLLTSTYSYFELPFFLGPLLKGVDGGGGDAVVSLLKSIVLELAGL